MWEVKFDEQAIDFLGRLPKDIKERVFNKILSAKHNPFHFFESFEGKEGYKMRVGDYRIIADSEYNPNIIKVRLIGHRKNIYHNV
jgi:mRNA interferase RelE/StbE